MVWLSRDGESYLGVGAGSVCTECDETTHLADDRTQHAPHCSRAFSVENSQPAARRRSDPNVYVMTPNGFEKAGDVERRREQRLKGR